MLAVGSTAHSAAAADPAPAGTQAWQVGTPIVTYWAGPPLTDAVAQQMAEGGFNVVWCTEQQLDTAQRHGLRAQLSDGLLSPATLDDPAGARQARRPDRARPQPPRAVLLLHHRRAQRGGVSGVGQAGRLLCASATRRTWPTSTSSPPTPTTSNWAPKAIRSPRTASTCGSTCEIVKPALISYDHYQFAKDGDNGEYFLNLAMIRRASQDAGCRF